MAAHRSLIAGSRNSGNATMRRSQFLRRADDDLALDYHGSAIDLDAVALRFVRAVSARAE